MAASDVVGSFSAASPPVFSVVIPAYDAAATVAAAVSSALLQTRSDLEVVVVDDGSRDATAAVVAAIDDPRARLVSQPNRGLSAARNAGIAASSGKYVSFLDSDDLLLPRYLELVAAALEGTSDVGFAYTDAYAFDPLTGKVRRRTAMQRMRPPTPPPVDPAAFLIELLQRNFVYVSATVPRPVLTDVGGFDERRTSIEDYELWLKIVAHGYRPVWIPGQHALYRVHPGQMSADEKRMFANLTAVYQDLPLEQMPSEAHRALLRSRRGAAARELAIAAREAPIRGGLRRIRRTLGMVRDRLGLGDSWYEDAPPEVAEAFRDLTAV